MPTSNVVVQKKISFHFFFFLSFSLLFLSSFFLFSSSLPFFFFLSFLFQSQDHNLRTSNSAACTVSARHHCYHTMLPPLATTHDHLHFLLSVGISDFSLRAVKVHHIGFTPPFHLCHSCSRPSITCSGKFHCFFCFVFYSLFLTLGTI